MKRSHRRPRTIVVAVVAAVLAGAAGVAWFQPQKLLINQRVDEALPVAVTPTSGALDTSLSRPGTRPSGLEPTILSTSLFRSLGHATSGHGLRALFEAGKL